MQTAQPVKATPSGFKLPKLNLPTFHGDVTKWLEFYDLFSCSIHNNNNLTDIQKLTYLKGQLGGEAAKLISGFKLEGSNYNPAIQLLIDNYGRKDRISYALITQLTSLTKLIVITQSHLNSSWPNMRASISL